MNLNQEDLVDRTVKSIKEGVIIDSMPDKDLENQLRHPRIQQALKERTANRG